ncbi:hypothetical protein ACHAXS_005540 [Conticribra weissflogii]
MNVANPDEHEVGAMVLSRKRQQPDEATTDFGIPATIARLAGPLNEPTAESPPCVNIPETSLRLEDVKPTFEPLKVCLDDDSSLDDGEENIFDDKDFYFGDEDIQSLMARDTKSRKISTSNTSHIQPSRILSPPASLSCATLTLNASVPSREVDTMFTAAKSNSQAPAETANAIKQPTSEAILLSSASSCPSGEHKGVLALFLVYQNELRRTLVSSFPVNSVAPSLGDLTLVSQESLTPHSSRRNSGAEKSKIPKRRVTLRDDVAVIPIPMRTEYPDAIRARIWSSAVELYENAARNSIEFAAEGWNWRTVTDDEYMVQSASGERIHPIHFINTFPSTQNTLYDGECDTGEKNISSKLDVQVGLHKST